MGGRVYVGEARSYEIRHAVSPSEPPSPPMRAGETQETAADELLVRAVHHALETEHSKAVAEWLRRAAESVERGDYEN